MDRAELESLWESINDYLSRFPELEDMGRKPLGLQPEALKAVLVELSTLIAAHFVQECGQNTPQLQIREDTGRKRLILSWSLSRASVASPSAPAINKALRDHRQTYLQTLASSLGGSAAALYTQEGQLKAYEVVVNALSYKAFGTEAAQPEISRQEAASPELAPTSPPSREEKKKRRQAELRAFFMESLGEDIRALVEARDSENWEAARQKAHQLKGCAASFGFPEITEMAAALDDAVKSGQSQDYSHLLARLVEGLNQAQTSPSEER